jgi:hypothetical protein
MLSIAIKEIKVAHGLNAYCASFIQHRAIGTGKVQATMTLSKCSSSC